MVKNLVSVRKLTRDNNISVEFDPHGFSIKDLQTSTVMLRCDSSGDLYPLRSPQHFALTASPVTTDLWHARLGHPGNNTLSQILHSFDFSCNKSAAHVCHSCQLGKHVRHPFHSSQTVTYFPFQLVHSDVWTSPVYNNSVTSTIWFSWMITPITSGPFPFETNLMFYPFFSHFMHMSPLSLAYLGLFCRPTMAVNLTMQPSVLFFLIHGVTLRLSCPYTSQQNGKAERSGRLTIACAQCFFTAPLRRSSGQRRSRRRRSFSTGAHVAAQAWLLPMSFHLAFLLTTPCFVFLARCAIPI
jgi:hypothetical protein